MAGIAVETLEELTSNLFGKATKEMQERMNTMLEQFQRKIESVKDTTESVDTKKYQKLVNDFTSSIQKEYELSKDQMEKLETFLKSDYQKVLQATKSK
jgi:wobble nucleotide-excising tRNase